MTPNLTELFRRYKLLRSDSPASYEMVMAEEQLINLFLIHGQALIEALDDMVSLARELRDGVLYSDELVSRETGNAAALIATLEREAGEQPRLRQLTLEDSIVKIVRNIVTDMTGAA
jgi:hypothetical protein